MSVLRSVVHPEIYYETDKQHLFILLHAHNINLYKDALLFYSFKLTMSLEFVKSCHLQNSVNSIHAHLLINMTSLDYKHICMSEASCLCGPSRLLINFIPSVLSSMLLRLFCALSLSFGVFLPI